MLMCKTTTGHKMLVKKNPNIAGFYCHSKSISFYLKSFYLPGSSPISTLVVTSEVTAKDFNSSARHTSFLSVWYQYAMISPSLKNRLYEHTESVIFVNILKITSALLLYIFYVESMNIFSVLFSFMFTCPCFYFCLYANCYMPMYVNFKNL